MTTNSNLRGFILILLVSCSLITGVIFDYLPAMIDVGIKRHIQLATNEEIINFWSKPPIDIDTYYWLFHVTNPDEFMAGEKAHIGRVGPYHLTSRMTKNIISYSDNMYRVTFNTSRLYKLDETPGSLDASFDTPIMALNPIYAAVAGNVRERVRSMPNQASTVLASITKLADKFNETLLMSLSPRSILLGRHSVFVEKAKRLAETFGQEMSGANVSPEVGYVAVTNGTQVGPYQIFTGYQASASSLGDLISFQGRKRGLQFSGACNRIQTSIGELRPMPIEPNSRLEMYQPMIDRIIHLKPTGMKRIREGWTLNYMFDERDFESAEMNPELGCFCKNDTLDSYCSLRGAIELGSVLENVPLLFTVSFIEPDERIKSSIANWDHELVSSDLNDQPNIGNNTHMLILKRFGIPFRADLAITMYMKVIRDKAFKHTANVPNVTYLPLFTQRELITVPDKFIKPIIDLEALINLTRHLKLVMYMTSLILLAWLSSMLYRRSSAHSAGHRVVPSGHPEAGLSPDGARANEQALATTSAGIFGATAIGDAIAIVGAPKPDHALPRRASMGVPMAAQAANGVAPPRARIFSKIDEDIVARQAQLKTQMPRPTSKVGPAASQYPERPDEPPPVPAASTSASGQQPDASPTGSQLRRRSSVRVASNVNLDAVSLARGADSRASSIGGSTAAGDEGAPNSKTNRDNNEQPDEAPGEASDPPAGGRGFGRRRNWFVRAYMDVVRVLTDIRLSISNASKLDVTENDSQDRQLELLAGKIDNWYVDRAGHESSTPSQDGATQATAGETDEQNNLDQKAHNEAGEQQQPKSDNTEPPGSARLQEAPAPKLGMQDGSSQTTIDHSNAEEVDGLTKSDSRIMQKRDAEEQCENKVEDERQGGQELEQDLIDESDNNVDLDSDKDTEAADKANALQQLEQTIGASNDIETASGYGGDGQQEAAPDQTARPPANTTTRPSVRRQAGTDPETDSQGAQPEAETKAGVEPKTGAQADQAEVESHGNDEVGKGEGQPAEGAIEIKQPSEAKDMRRDSGVKMESREIKRGSS